MMVFRLPKRPTWERVKLAASSMFGLDLRDVFQEEMAALAEAPKFKYGFEAKVHKDSGDYIFSGWVRSCWTKRSGAIRYNVENPDGVVHIFNEGQLKPGWPDAGPAQRGF